jgi:hypothetical protein
MRPVVITVLKVKNFLKKTVCEVKERRKERCEKEMKHFFDQIKLQGSRRGAKQDWLPDHEDEAVG